MLVFARPSIYTIIIGLIFVISGEVLRLWGVAYAGALTRVTGSVGAPELIMAGPYSYVRNPLYLGNMLLYFGFGVMSNALFPWLLVVAMIWFVFQYYQIVILEEDFLSKKFAELYREYAKHVPRFFPTFTPYVNSDIQSRQFPDWRVAFKSERRTFQALGIVTVSLIIIYWLR